MQNFPKDAEDLILQLLQSNPLDRLGSGSKGPLNDFSTLKAHKFFDGIDFDSIVKINPPNLNEIKEKIEAAKAKKEAEKIKQKTNDNNSNNNNLNFKKNNNNQNIINPPNYNYCEPIKDIKEGILKKKSPWFHYNTRKVILDTEPKCVYKDPSTGIKKVNMKFKFFDFFDFFCNYLIFIYHIIKLGDYLFNEIMLCELYRYLCF